jgi:GNAT superfamily N-acetyltransferase
MSYIYKIHRLPTSDPLQLAFLAGRFSSLRLSALTTSPNAFATTFADESKLTSSQWVSRLIRPLVHTFIAIAYSSDTAPEDQVIDAGDWIGSATVLGPLLKAKYELPESGGEAPESDEKESKWQMTAVYNSPLHRGKGVAKLLIEDAVKFTEEEAKKEGNGNRMRIMIKPDNVVVKKMYGGLGFVDAGMCTLAEAFEANGDEGMVPADGGKSQPEKWNNRLGLIMEKVV